MRSIAVVAVVFVLMLFEAMISRKHERRLRELGAIEPPDDVYGQMQVVYPLAFLVPALEGWLRTPSTSPLEIVGLVTFIASKSLKYWAISTLGDRWTFRVLVPPRSSRTRKGPYRLLAHPNYVAVAGEILGAGLFVGGPWSATLFTTLFAALMLKRVRVEERALS